MSSDPPSESSARSFLSFTLSDRDIALLALHERDLEAQLVAIKSLLKRNEQADKAVSEEIEKLDQEARDYRGDDPHYQMHLEDAWIDAMTGTVFQDAAHSMAAVGMLAPFIESLFSGLFIEIRTLKTGEVSESDPRSISVEDQYWDPHIYYGKTGAREDLVAGIVQLSKSTGLQPYLPDGLSRTLGALFGYRNNMFHNGFEWPAETRKKFAERILAEKWPEEWFRKAETGGQPWIFYMSPSFIDHCLQTIDRVIEGAGRFIKDNRTRSSQATGAG